MKTKLTAYNTIGWKLVSVLTIFLLCSSTMYAQDLEKIKDQKPFAVSGNISAGLNYFHTNDTLSRRMPLQWMVNGNVNFSIYGINIPIAVAFSSQNKNFKLPFNRIGMSPNYKWAKLHLGWRSLNYNSYTLGGQHINGVGFELTPKLFNISFIWGQLNNALTDVSVYNNLNNKPPIYRRMAYAFNLGYGTKESNISLSVLRAGDKLRTANLDLKDQARESAAANLAIGLKGQVTFLKHFRLSAEGAVSGYTRDLESDSLPLPEKYARNVFIKHGFVPPINYSSTFAFAVNSSLTYFNKDMSISFQYQRVNPDYRSMGAFFMQTDVEQYTLAPSFTAWKKKIYFVGSFGVQRNNLHKQSSTKSFRTIGMANLNIAPIQNLNFTLQYTNYGISQEVLNQYQSPTSDYTFYDSIRISQISQSFTFGTNYSHISEKNVHVFSLMTSFQNLKDNNSLNQGQGDFTSITSNFNYNWQLLPINFDVNHNVTFINTKTNFNSIGSAGYTLTLSKGIKLSKDDPLGKKQDLRLLTSLSGHYFANLLDGDLNAHATGGFAGIGFQFYKKHNMNVNFGILSQMDASGFVKTRNEFTMQFRYNYRF